MIGLRLERRDAAPIWLRIALPIGAIFLTLLVCSTLIILAGAHVGEAYAHLFLTPFSGRFDTVETAVKATPLILTGLAVVLREDELFLEFALLGQSGGEIRSSNEIVLLPSGTRPEGAFVIGITRSWMDVVPLGPTAVIEAQCHKLLDMITRFDSAPLVPLFQNEAAILFDLLLRPVWNRAGVAMDRLVVLLGFLMIAMTGYVAIVSRPPIGAALVNAVLPAEVDVLAITALIGGTVGGYITYAGAHRLLDSGVHGVERVA